MRPHRRSRHSDHHRRRHQAHGSRVEERCSVCYEALTYPQVHLDCCTHSLHPPRFCALRARAETELRWPTCRATATVDQSDRRAPQEHNGEVMSTALTTARRGMPEREETTVRRARLAVSGDAARGSRVIFSICNGVVEDRTYVRVVCSCSLHLRCTLGFVEDSAHSRTGSTTITCPNPASHSARQHITLGPLVALIRITLNTSSLADRVILTGRVLIAQRLFPEAIMAQGVVGLTRVTTTTKKADADEDGRGASSPQQNMLMPCGNEARTWRGVTGSASRDGPSIQGVR